MTKQDIITILKEKVEVRETMITLLFDLIDGMLKEQDEGWSLVRSAKYRRLKEEAEEILSRKG